MRRARVRYAKAAEWVPSLKVWATPITSCARFAPKRTGTAIRALIRPMLRSPQFASKRMEQVELWGFAVFLIRTEEQGAHTACRH